MMKTTRKSISEEALRNRLAGLCARSEQCESDLRIKIMRAGLQEQEADNIIGFLKEKGFLDDTRFAGAFVRDKARFAGWGPARIRQALIHKHFPTPMVDEALQSIDEAVLDESLIRTAKAKARTLNLHDRNDLMKLCRHLMMRGFSYDDFKKVLPILREE